MLMDFADLDGKPALKALESALRHSAHVLGHDSSDWLGADLLASQILGRLQSKCEPEVQALCAHAAEQLAGYAGLRPVIDSLRSAEALLRTLAGHADLVWALAVLADGWLASPGTGRYGCGSSHADAGRARSGSLLTPISSRLSKSGGSIAQNRLQQGAACRRLPSKP